MKSSALCITALADNGVSGIVSCDTPSITQDMRLIQKRNPMRRRVLAHSRHTSYHVPEMHLPLTFDDLIIADPGVVTLHGDRLRILTCAGWEVLDRNHW